MAEPEGRYLVAPPLFTHQVWALAFLADKVGAAIHADLGTGKTRIVIEDAKRKQVGLFIVCPKSAIIVWERELKKWGFDGPRIVLNYEQVWRKEDDIERALQSLPLDIPWMMVADEAHRLKGRTTKQSKAVRRLARLDVVAYRRTLTGTPVVNGYQDLWPQYDFLLPDLLGKWRQYAGEYLIFHPMFKSKVEGVRNISHLQSILAPFTFSVRARDVLDLPPTTELPTEVELDAKTRRAYRELEEQLYTELDGEIITAPNMLVKILRLAQITGESPAKRAAFAEVVESLPPDEKFVVFCRFVADSAVVRGVLDEYAIYYETVHGGQSSTKRGQAIDAFQFGDARALVVQIQAGSESIDLTAARYAIYYSVGFSFKDYWQSRARIYRQGQTKPCFYVHIIVAHTIDEFIYEALVHKQGVHEAVQSWWRAGH